MKLTVIIPTRERADTLGAALRTCIHQRYDDLSILVSDNCSADNTAEVVHSFADKRIRYLNTGRRLAMSANWEFALSHVDGGYVTIIGDDDGLLPDAAADLAKLLDELGRPPLLGWKKAVYHWPNFHDETMRDSLSVPLQAGVVREDARVALAQLMRFERPYGSLPGLYNAVVDVSLVRGLGARSQGFFHSSSPDIYSAVALAASLPGFHFSSRPYGIGGQSSHSTGSSNFRAGAHSSAFEQFMSEGNVPFHSDLEMAPSLPILTAESYLQVRDHLQPELRDYDLERTLTAALSDAVAGPAAPYRRTLEAVRAIAARHDRAPLGEELASTFPHRAVAYTPDAGYNPLRRAINVRASDFAAYDVFDAAMLTRHLLDLHERRYFDMRGVVRTTLSAAVRSGWRRLARTLSR